MTARLPALSLELPDGFHELPIDTPDSDRDEAITALVQDLYPQGNAALQAGITPLLANATRAMADADLTLAAIGLFSDGPERVAQCALTLAVAASNHPNPEAAARGMHEILARTSSVEAQYLDLPCGPAAVGISVRQVTYDGAYTATGRPASVRMGRLQAYIPFPTGPYMAVLTLDTPAMNYWENFSVMMGSVLMALEFPEDVSFGAPVPAETPPAQR